MDNISHVDTFNRYVQVSRETIISLNKFEELIIEGNKKTNLIGKSTISQIWTRHFLDSFQVIDFIDKNDNRLIDLGSGAGFPGIVLAIASKEKKIPLKITLIEKSPKKVKFLKATIKQLKLNVEVSNLNVFEQISMPQESVFIARAFKPLGIILELMHNKVQNWKKIFVFLGKTGKKEILEASKIWDIGYKQRMSITSSDSIIIEINKLKKK